MKFRHTLPILLAVGVSLASLAETAQAQRAGRQGKMNLRSAQQEVLAGRGGFRPGQAAEKADPFAALGLTAEQQTALQALREQHRAQMEEFRASGSRPTAEEIQALRQQHRAELEKILTPEQLAKLEEFRANGSGMGRDGDGQGKGFRPGTGVGWANPFAGLDLTEEQKATLQQLREELRTQMEEFRASGTRPTAEEIQAFRQQHRAELEKVLTPEQLAKLEELRANWSGMGRHGGDQGKGFRPGTGVGWANPFAGLDLTEEQKATLQQLREELREEMKSLRTSGARPSREELQALREEHRQAVEAILTPEQLEKLRGRQSDQTDAASKPAGAAVESRSWGEIKGQAK